MSTKAILGLIAAIVIVGGSVWYFSSQPGMPQEGAETTEAEAATFAELMARTGSWQCSVETFIEEAPSQGTVYISDGRVRADFTSQPEAMGGQSVTSHMIQADGYVYTWSDMYPQGMKMPIPEGAADANAPGGVPNDARVEYHCDPWPSDASVFTAPSNVTFMELGDSGFPPGYPMPQ